MQFDGTASLMSTMSTRRPKSQFLSVTDLDSRVARRRSSYMDFLGSIASDLDMMLSDLCEVFPETASGSEKPSSPTSKSRQISNEEFEDYISCADEAEKVDVAGVSESSDTDDNRDSPVFIEELPMAPSPHKAPTVCEQLAAGVKDIDVVDRLIPTHPVWYQPSTTSHKVVVHMLHAQRLGSFIVYQSSEVDCMTLAVRVLEDSHFVVKEYTIKRTLAGVKLQGVDRVFDTVPKLIAHLCKFQECLSTQLVLPIPILHANSTQELSALGLLGPDFWTSSMNRSATLSASDLARLSINSRAKRIRTEMLVPVSENAETDEVRRDEPLYSSDIDGVTSTVKDPLTEKVYLGRRSNTLPPGQRFTKSAFDERPRTISAASETPRDKSSSLTSESGGGKRYPAPISDPPPPPTDVSPAIRTATQTAVSEFAPTKVVDRNSGEYYKPFEPTRQGHRPPSAFGIDSDRLPVSPPRQAPPPPLPAKRSSAIPAAAHTNRDPYAEPSSRATQSTKVFLDPWTPVTSDPPYGAPGKSATPPSKRKTWATFDTDSDKHVDDRKSLCSEYSTTSSHSVDSTISAESKSTGISSILDNLSNTSFSTTDRTSFVSVASETENRNSDSANSSILDEGIPIPGSKGGAGILEPVRTPSPRNSDLRFSVSDFDPLASSQSDDDNNLTLPRGQWAMFNQSVRIDKKMLALHEDYKQSADSTSRDSAGSCGSALSVSESDISRDSVFTDPPEHGATSPSADVFATDDVNCPRPRQRTSRIPLSLSRQRGGSSDAILSDPLDSSRWEDLLNLRGAKQRASPDIPEGDDTSDEKESLENGKPSRDGTLKRPEVAATPTKTEPVTTAAVPRKGSGRGGNKKNSIYKDKHNKSNAALKNSIFYVIADDRTSLIESDEKENVQEKSARRRSSAFGAVKQKIKYLARSPRRNKQDPSGKIQSYIIKTSTNMNTTFGSSVAHFIQCTKDSTETNPNIVMRNVRQFMDGIKHYLLQEDFDFQAVLHKEMGKMVSDEPINEDAIIEGALHKCIIKPLNSRIRDCLFEEFTRNGSAELLNRNLQAAKNKTNEELGIRDVFIPPQGASIGVLEHFFTKMYKAYSPLTKMDCLLRAVSTIYKSTQDTRPGHEAVHSMGADDFLPVFIYVLAQCNVRSAEIDADYMQGLLEPNLLLGQGGYYLTTLISAVYVIKNLHLEDNNGENSSRRLPCISDMQGFLKISFLDVESGALMSKTLPITPTMTTADVCQLIAGKLDLENTEEYGLYVIVDEEERLLDPKECPQQLKADLHLNEKRYLFGYRLKNITVAWQSHM